VKYWEIIADNLSKAGWSWGCVSIINSSGQTIWIADAHRDNGKRFIGSPERKVHCVCGTRNGHNTVDSDDQSCCFGAGNFCKAKHRENGAGNDRHVIKVTKETTMQYLILLAVISMMVLYVLIIGGCLCYVGRHGRRTS
jgi:hypothetical protein